MMRRWRRRFGISASRVAVRTHVSWYWWVISALLVVVVTIAVGNWMYDAGRRFAGFDRSASEQAVAALQEQSAGLQNEVIRLRGLADAGESRLQIELAAQQQLVRQVKGLEDENARLKDDLAVFESLARTDAQAGGLTINRLRVEPDDGVPNRYRYRMLVIIPGTGKDQREFTGNLQLAINFQQQGRDGMMLLPLAAEADSSQYHISFKNFRHIDGSFTVSPGARVTSVEIRLLKAGVLKVSKSVTL